MRLHLKAPVVPTRASAKFAISTLWATSTIFVQKICRNSSPGFMFLWTILFWFGLDNCILLLFDKLLYTGFFCKQRFRLRLCLCHFLFWNLRFCHLVFFGSISNLHFVLHVVGHFQQWRHISSRRQILSSLRLQRLFFQCFHLNREWKL